MTGDPAEGPPQTVPEFCGCGACWPHFGLSPPLVRTPVVLCRACLEAHPVNAGRPRVGSDSAHLSLVKSNHSHPQVYPQI